MSDIIPNFLQLCIICTRFYDIYQLSSLHHFIWLVFLVWHCNMSFICRFLQAKVKFYKCSQNFMFLPKLIFFYTRPPCQILDHKMFSFLSDADTGTSISRQVLATRVVFFILVVIMYVWVKVNAPWHLIRPISLQWSSNCQCLSNKESFLFKKKKKKAVQNNMITEWYTNRGTRISNIQTMAMNRQIRMDYLIQLDICLQKLRLTKST